MIKNWRAWLGVAGIAGSLGAGALATAQTSTFQPFKGLFGAKAAPQPKAIDSNRATEIQVEQAWLSDRMTFPYFLEAHVKGSSLEVRGYVPTRAIREQAVALAKVNCTLAVIDAVKEHGSLAVQSPRRPPEQLKSAAQTALREAFPGQSLAVQCESDGTVQIAGAVRSLEQKLAVSQSLRRLHGCTSVTNMTHVDGEIIQQSVSATKNAKAQAVPANELGDHSGKVAQEQKRGGLLALFTKNTPPQAPQADSSSVKTVSADPIATKTQPASVGVAKLPTQPKSGQPYESRGVVVVAGDDSPGTKNAPATKVASNATETRSPDVKPVSNATETRTTVPAPTPKAATPGTAATASQLKKQIETAVPGARNVNVTFTSKTDVHVECTARTNEDSGTIAGQILSLRELDAYKIDLQIQLPAPDRK